MSDSSKSLTGRIAALMLVMVLALGTLAAAAGVAPVTAAAKMRTQVTQVAKHRAIGKKRAIAIALKDARLKKKQVKRLKATVDREDGRKVYEVEFRRGKFEYEYDIDVYSGEICDRDIERTKR